MTILASSTQKNLAFWLIWLSVVLSTLFLAWHMPVATAEPVIAGYVLRPNTASAVTWIGITQRRLWALAWWHIRRWQNAWQVRLVMVVRVWSCRSQAELIAALSRWQVTRQLGALPVLVRFLQRLKVRETINRYCPTQGQVDHGAVALVLVLNRLMAPRALYKIADWLATTMIGVYLGVAPGKFNDDRLGRTLDALAEHLPEIWNDIRQQALLQYKIDLSVLFYDLTALIMTGKYAESELVDYGFAGRCSLSPNTPSDDPKIKLGLTASQDGGIPLLFQAWSGRTADKSTVQTNMQQLEIFLQQQVWERPQVLVVGDCANLNSELALAYDKALLRYLAGLPKLEKAHRDLLLAPSEKDFRRTPLAEGYWGVPCSVPFTHNGPSVTHRGLIVLSGPKQALREQRQEDLQALYQALQQVKSKIGQKRYRSEKEVRQRADTQLKHSPVGKLVQATVTTADEGNIQLRWSVDTAAWHLAQQADGRYFLVTNDPKLSYRQMLKLYRQKDAVEKRFKVSKQVIKMRPLFVHSDERIQAMLLINLIALLVYSLIERQTQQHGICLTTRNILEKLANLQVQHIEAWDGSQSWSFGELTPEQHSLLAVLLQAVDCLPLWPLPATDQQPILQLSSGPPPSKRQAPLPS